MKTVMRAVALVAGLITASGAMAASALVTTDLNLRAGPSTRYQSVGVLPDGAIVDVRGCASGYSWCRVSYRGYEGWASSRYLAHQEDRYYGRRYSDSTAAAIGIPLIAGAIIAGALADDDDDYYHRRHYRHRDRWDRPRYRHRDRWDGPRYSYRDWDDDDDDRHGPRRIIIPGGQLSGEHRYQSGR